MSEPSELPPTEEIPAPLITYIQRIFSVLQDLDRTTEQDDVYTFATSTYHRLRLTISVPEALDQTQKIVDQHFNLTHTDDVSTGEEYADTERSAAYLRAQTMRTKKKNLNYNPNY